jgi:hypothetical protein
MNRVTRTLSALLAAGMLLVTGPSAAWAEKNIPPGAPPPVPVNPNAVGRLLTGFFAVAYDFQEPPFENLDCPGLVVRNLYAVLTLRRGDKVIAFSRDLSQTTPPSGPFCFGEADPPFEVGFVSDLVSTAVPAFFKKCRPGVACHAEVKSVTNFQSTGRGLLTMNITIAVQVPSDDHDD